MNIKEIIRSNSIRSNSGTPISDYFIISEIYLKPFAKKDGNFLQFKLSDKTGKISANIWNNAENFYKNIQNDTVVQVTGSISSFEGKNQIIVETMSICLNYDEKKLVACTLYDPEVMFEELSSILYREVKDEGLQFIRATFLDNPEFVSLFKKCPGGKGGVHHAYIGGLLEHTLAVLKLALSIAENSSDS